VIDGVPVERSTMEKIASVKAEGLKMRISLPSRFQRTNALPANPMAISRNCQ